MKLGFEIPTWDQIYSLLLNQAERIRRNGFNPDGIVGISRGGWVPARVLSDLLNNSNLANVRAEFYVGVAETQKEPVLTQPVSMDVTGKKVLIVDEVADTGKSLRLVRDHIIGERANEAKTATLYYKPWSIVTPDYYEKETNRWIVFPWEIKETIRKIMKKCREEEKPMKEEVAELTRDGISSGLVKRFLQEILEEENC